MSLTNGLVRIPVSYATINTTQFQIISDYDSVLNKIWDALYKALYWINNDTYVSYDWTITGTLKQETYVQNTGYGNKRVDLYVRIESCSHSAATNNDVALAVKVEMERADSNISVNAAAVTFSGNGGTFTDTTLNNTKVEPRHVIWVPLTTESQKLTALTNAIALTAARVGVSFTGTAHKEPANTSWPLDQFWVTGALYNSTYYPSLSDLNNLSTYFKADLEAQTDHVQSVGFVKSVICMTFGYSYSRYGTGARGYGDPTPAVP